MKEVFQKLSINETKWKKKKQASIPKSCSFSTGIIEIQYNWDNQWNIFDPLLIKVLSSKCIYSKWTQNLQTKVNDTSLNYYWLKF